MTSEQKVGALATPRLPMVLVPRFGEQRRLGGSGSLSP